MGVYCSAYFMPRSNSIVMHLLHTTVMLSCRVGGAGRLDVDRGFNDRFAHNGDF